MTQNKNDKKLLVVDEINTLRVLYAIRANMQSYSQGNITPQTPDNIISIYNALVKAQSTPETVAAINEQISFFMTDFIKNNTPSINIRKPKTTTEKQDKARQKEQKAVSEHNKYIKPITSALREELSYLKSNGQYSDISADCKFESISYHAEDNKETYHITIAGHPSPLIIRIREHKGKKSTMCCVTTKKGLKPSHHDFLITSQSIQLSEKQNLATVGKKYSKSEYKKISGIINDDKLSSELEFINSLSLSDQQEVISLVQQRQKTAQAQNKLLSALAAIDDKLGLLSSPQKASTLQTQTGDKDIIAQTKDFIITKIISNDTANVWQHFSQNSENKQEYHSLYKKYLLNTINSPRFKIIFNTLLSPETSEPLEQQISTAFSSIQKSCQPLLSSALTAEILAFGVFKTGISTPTDTAKLKKMNLILNEFGVNIAFEELKVTKAPDMSIENASGQMSEDRATFESYKKWSSYKERLKNFEALLKQQFAQKPYSQSTHHYTALKYNGFVDQNLNEIGQYVLTAQQNPWNVDAHSFVHLFDTDGIFLIRQNQDTYSNMDFNMLRHRFNNNEVYGRRENLYIMAPILQICDSKTKQKKDILAKEHNGKGGYYISDNNTPNIINIPNYCIQPYSNNNTNMATPKKGKQR